MGNLLSRLSMYSSNWLTLKLKASALAKRPSFLYINLYTQALVIVGIESELLFWSINYIELYNPLKSRRREDATHLQNKLNSLAPDPSLGNDRDS